jgi:adenine-specific DNA-methyltransferase
MSKELLQRLHSLNEDELRRELTEILTRQRLGLVWEHSAIERDRAINANVVLPRLDHALSHNIGPEPCQNLIIEGDNFDSLRLLRATHANKIRVIYIDPPYNTGNKDWVYNDSYVGKNDRWRHSQWLEFLYQRLILARDLLTPDGVILVSINDENRSRLELLMDEVFPGRRLGSLVWRTKDTGNDLAQRFSHVHEHVLVYANEGFSFNGRATDKSKFRNPDNDPNGDWSPQPLTKAHSYLDRENTYYPIQDPDTGYWYPCDPNRVWAYASEKVIRNLCKGDEDAVKAALAALRSDTMEALIAKRLIYFPPCKSEDVLRFETKADLLAAIKEGKGPVLPKKKTPLLRADLPDLDFWVGKPIAPGRPSRKEHWTARPEADRLAPLGSWIAGMNEDIDDEDVELSLLRSARGGVATDEVKHVLGSKAFQHPKPLSLIKGLLSQATRPTDIVLDFFAGSGTTGHAVLELNKADGGRRRFILCSNSEATDKERDKNLCRDVCAERVRRVMNGYGNDPGLSGSFAYIKLDLMDPVDVQLDAGAHQITQLLSLRLQGAAIAPPSYLDHMIVLAASGDIAAVYLPNVTREAIDAAVALPHRRLLVFSSRPDTVQELIEAAGKLCDSRAVGKEIVAGQAGMEQTDLRARTQIEESL